MNTDLPNSLLRISWTLPVFGMEQMLKLATRGQVTTALDEVSAAARAQITGSMNQVAEAYEKAQQSMMSSMTSVGSKIQSATSHPGESQAPPSTPSAAPRQEGWGPVQPIS